MELRTDSVNRLFFSFASMQTVTSTTKLTHSIRLARLVVLVLHKKCASLRSAQKSIKAQLAEEAEIVAKQKAVDEEAKKLEREKRKEIRERKEKERLEKLEKLEEEPSPSAVKITLSKDRRCVGRKPITDFAIDSTHSGTVMYIKDFGCFIDINSHSDAFCHVSRISDDFVKDINDVVKVGDKVEVRVVEVDKKKKRLTVSMQSEKRKVDEAKSREMMAERKENKLKGIHKSKPKKIVPSSPIPDGEIRISKMPSSSSKYGSGGNVYSNSNSNAPKQAQVAKNAGLSAKEQRDEEKRLAKIARRAARREEETS